MKRASIVRAVLIAFLTLILIIPFMSAGCGSVDVNIHTTIKPSGDFIQELRLKGSGMMGAALTTPETIESLKKEGWQVTTERSGDSVSLVATKQFKKGESVTMPDFSKQGTGLKQVKFDVKNFIAFKEYFLEMTLPASPIDTAGGQYAELTKSMLKSMFSMSWTLSLPGNIVETNADAVQDNSATWYFDVDSLAKDRYMMVHTRYVNWPIIGIIAGVVVVGVGLFILFVVRRRTPKAEGWAGVYHS